MKTPFGSMYVTIYEKEDGDEGARVFIGKDNIAFRIIKTKNTENGLYTESRELCWSNVKLRSLHFGRGEFAGCRCLQSVFTGESECGIRHFRSYPFSAHSGVDERGVYVHRPVLYAVLEVA